MKISFSLFSSLSHEIPARELHFWPAGFSTGLNQLRARPKRCLTLCCVGLTSGRLQPLNHQRVGGGPILTQRTNLNLRTPSSFSATARGRKQHRFSPRYSSNRQDELRPPTPRQLPLRPEPLHRAVSEGPRQQPSERRSGSF